MKIIINEVLKDLPELDIFKLCPTEWVTIPETEGIFCFHCGCPVRFNMKAPGQMLGRCKNCSHIMMQHRSSGKVSWDDAGVVMFDPTEPRKVVMAIDEQKAA